jgi:hypothetical protein
MGLDPTPYGARSNRQCKVSYPDGYAALARLTDSAKNSNSLESRFDLAYNAAHALCLAALRWHGYRPIATSSFKYCPTRLDWARKFGACWINVIRFATLENMKAILMWMSASDLVVACWSVAAKLDLLAPIPPAVRP